MALHLIQKSPFKHSAFSECLNAASDSDLILLMEDGVYGCHHSHLDNINNKVYAIQDDLEARGISPSFIVESIDYKAFVALCESNQHIISWY